MHVFEAPARRRGFVVVIDRLSKQGVADVELRIVPDIQRTVVEPMRFHGGRQVANPSKGFDEVDP